MYAIRRHVRQIGALLLLVAALAALGAAIGGSTAMAAPAAAPAMAPLPLATCTSPAAGERVCDLWAKTGTLTLADGNIVNIWGFADTAGGAAQLPGPALIVNQGEKVTVNLTNDVAGETISLVFPGQNLIPDLTGVEQGLSASYVFTPTVPGTYSYEAGLTVNGARQVAMGLYGALVVRPAGHANWAYDGTSAFAGEALLVLNEIDPDFNADPNGFMLQSFRAEYWLINGKSFPETEVIATTPGERVLLRYLNGGVRSRYVAVLGLEQTVLGIDSSPLPYTYTVTSEALGSGQALDVMVNIPAAASEGERYALYSPGLQLHNAGALAGDGTAGFGGLLTFLQVSGGAVVTDVGPLANNVDVTPNPTTGAAGVTVSADLADPLPGTSTVTAWEVFVNELDVDGSGTYSYTVSTPAASVSVSTVIPPSELALLPAGDVTFYVHGQDANGNWGPVSSAVLDLVTEGPVIRSQNVTPATTNGTVDVILRATADETPTGDLNVEAAEYFIDTAGTSGNGTPLALNQPPAPVVGLEATIPVATVLALDPGSHTIWIHGQDQAGTWGAFGTVELTVDKTGPHAEGISLLPNPNNGSLALNSYANAVRLTVLISDTYLIEEAEGFIDYDAAVDADGTGFPLMAVDALFNMNLENAYVDIPLATINLLSEGLHSVDFHGKDRAGNWGPIASMPLTIDKTGPTATGLNITPGGPTAGAWTVELAANVTDSASNIVVAEWYRDTDPGPGNGSPMVAVDGTFDSLTEAVTATLSVGSWTNGGHQVWVRARDAAGNWGPAASIDLTVSGNNPNNILIDSFESGAFSAWAQAFGAVGIGPEAAMHGALGMKATLNGIAPAYLADRNPAGERSYRASFYFHPNNAGTAGQRHDILVGQNAEGTQIFGLQFEQGAGGPEVRAWVRSGGVDTFTNWYHIANAAQQLAIEWESGADAALSLYVDGALQETLTGLDTAAYQLEEVRLGPSGNLAVGMSGVEYYDGFASSRGLNAQNRLYLPIIHH